MKIRFYHAIVTVTLIGMFAGQGCTYHNEETLYPKDTTTTDTIVKYSAKLQPLFDTKCKSCHNAGMGRPFVCATHASVSSYLGGPFAINDFIERIDFKTGSGITDMPQGGPQLPEADRLAIKRWINQGKQNN